MNTQDVSKKFKFNQYDAAVARKLIELEETPEAIIYFSKVSENLSDYAYWYFLSTLWVSYTGYSDINLWKQLFSAKRKFKTPSIMKPSEIEEFNKLNSNITAYRVHRNGETDWIAYTLNLDIAKRFAKERNVSRINNMEKIWSYRTPDTLTDSVKNEIIEKVFDAIVDNETCEDIGEGIVNYVTSKGYIFQEEIDD